MPTTPASKRGIRKRGIVKTKAAHVYARHPEDWYVEQPWIWERLTERENLSGGVWDPACGEGRVVKVMRRRGITVFGSDIKQRNGFKSLRLDFLKPEFEHTAIASAVDTIACNPPYRLALKFVERALELAQVRVAMILPANFDRGDERSRWLERTPLFRIYNITPRPSMPPGDSKEAKNPSGGITDYSVFVWLRGFDGEPTVRWLRKEP